MGNSYLEVTDQAVVSTVHGEDGGVGGQGVGQQELAQLAEGQKAAELMTKVRALHPGARKVTLDLEARKAYVFGKLSGRPKLADGEAYDALLKLTAAVKKARSKPEKAEKADKPEQDTGEAKAAKETAQD